MAVLTNVRSRDEVLAKYAGNIFLWLSTCNIDMKVAHIAGKNNPTADLLSRWFTQTNNVQKLQLLVHHKAYSVLFRTSLAYVAFMNWELNKVNASSLVCFLEGLHFNGVKVSQMANYLSAIKSTFTIYGLNVSCFGDQRLKLYQKAVQNCIKSH